MASVKVILYTHKTYSGGRHPIMLQIIDGNKAVKRKQLHTCTKDQWDDTTKRVNKKIENYSLINVMISDRVAEAEKAVLVGENPFLTVSNITLEEVIQLELERLSDAGKHAGHASITAVFNDLKTFYSNLKIPLKNIDSAWYNKFVGKLVNKGNKDNSINKKLKVLKRAITTNGGVLTSTGESFTHGRKETLKQKLTRDEFIAIANLELPEESRLIPVRDFFVLQVYLRGVRVGDLLQATSEHFKNSRFRYMSDKTGRHYDIKLLPEAEVIVNKYLNKYERLFPFFKWKPDPKLDFIENDKKRLKHKESCTAVINYNLKPISKLAGVKKNVSSHMAKHTYAKFADVAIKNPMLTMPLLGHSSLAVHQKYLEDIRKDDELDDAADLIF
ncbi:phage integrase [Pedobacter cryoconitis]|uniref:Phage integrase n=1 Tax=Pedobacter cryoconitis TaxID=188932 RepID=A0A127VI27_9SPHI|nr:phage integrase SAM-like domain-containing protein [Pedobacter cryoconitis]AMQ00976.1 phage integrase [Pedobacter cryoconitis]